MYEHRSKPRFDLVLERLDGCAEDGQRRPQLVRKILDETLPELGGTTNQTDISE